MLWSYRRSMTAKNGGIPSAKSTGQLLGQGSCQAVAAPLRH